MSKFSWLRKLIPVARIAGQAAVLAHPELEPLIDLAESAIPEIKAGPDRKAAVEAVSDEFIDAAVAAGHLTPERAAALRALRSEAIDATVTAKNAEQAATVAIGKFNALLSDLKAQ